MATATATMTPGTAAAAPGTSQALVPAGDHAATTANAANAAAAGGALVPAGGDLVAGARRVLQQPAVRRAIPAFVVILALLAFGLVYAWMQATPYRPVMPGLSEADQQAAYDALRTAEFKPKIDSQSGQLTVPVDRFHEARIFLASQGLPKTGAVGLEGLKDQSSMTTSQFMEQVRVNAAMEQELARSITQIGTIAGARVHLATPRQSVFVRERVAPKASVVVTPHPGRAVSASQVQAIVHLVSSSVPYLTPDNVTVVDNVGKLMTESAGDLKLGMTAAQSAHKQQLEELYRSRILQILGPVVGEANVRSQVNLALDFTQIESTTEDFDTADKGPRTRSEVLAEDRGQRRSAEGVPGALSNTAPSNPGTSTATQADPNKGQSESTGTTSSRSTRNYELDRTVRHVRNATGGVQRVSVAVVVNERPAPAPAPGASAPAANAPKSQPYSKEELDRMTELVRGVIGFDDKRGDLVSVVPARFEADEPVRATPWYLHPDVHLGFKSGMIALVALAFLFVVVRPVIRAVFVKPAEEAVAEDAEKKPADGELSEEDMRMIQLGEGDSLEEIKAKLKPKRSSISIDMLDTANTYDDKVALVRMLVAEDSARVANVFKNMIKVS
ncbi:flagellar basal-body MS-ring/collar protein FliF [Ramlibacter sp. MAHUQ-53]|uniref:flagellar basal-body MS-ring/collar protein FliF n=1 Tax=unclassified Ramlibacter TaxID=2617605 RepID=UPI00362935CF